VTAPVSILINIRYLLCDAKYYLQCTINQCTSINVFRLEDDPGTGKDWLLHHGRILQLARKIHGGLADVVQAVEMT
jgi:hypothetical protein